MMFLWGTFLNIGISNAAQIQRMTGCETVENAVKIAEGVMKEGYLVKRMPDIHTKEDIAVVYKHRGGFYLGYVFNKETGCAHMRWRMNEWEYQRVLQNVKEYNGEHDA
jgi:hypothetical protein